MIISMKQKETGKIETQEKVSMIKHDKQGSNELTILKEDSSIVKYDLTLWKIHNVMEKINISEIEINYVGQVLFTQCPMCGTMIAQSMTHENTYCCEGCGLKMDLKTEYISRKF